MAVQAATRWQVRLFGGLIVRPANDSRHAEKGQEKEEVRLETRKAAALLAYLAYYPGRSFARDLLAEQLWPGEDLDPVRDRFRQALAALKRTLEPGGTAAGSVILADRLEVRLNPESVQTDVTEYTHLQNRADHKNTPREDRSEILLQAASLYRGELLAGFYDDWIFPERTRLARQHHEICSRLALLLAGSGQFSDALTYGQKAVEADPEREQGHALLMRLYAAAGRRSEALRQYREWERILAEEDLTASQETRQLHLFLQNASPANALDGLLRSAEGKRPANAGIRPEATTVAPLRYTSLEPDGGAVPLLSPFYIVRPPDAVFHEAVQRRDSIVLVKGPRQIGKTSLLARGLQHARTSHETETRVVLTDFQKLTEDQLRTPQDLFLTLAEMITERLELDLSPESLWNPARGWNVNFERFLRRTVLGASTAPLVWGLDEADRLFAYPYRSEVFGLFRSWHNERAFDPDGPWSRLTLAIAYATEAHLFITDLNQSPFNVGTRLLLEDFTPVEVGELNQRYGSPLPDEASQQLFYELVGGHPYLVRRDLRALAEGERTLPLLESEANRDDGVYGDHLLRLLSVLRHEMTLCDTVRSILSGGECAPVDVFYRLRSAGIVLGASPQEARLRCRLYQRFLERHLAA